MNEQQHVLEPELNDQHKDMVFSVEGKARRNAFRASAALMAVVGGIAIGNLLSDESGEVTSYAPKVDSTPPLIDGDFRVYNQNMHGEMRKKEKDIREARKTLNPDVMAFQEVSARDARWLQKEFPDSYINYVKATSETKPFQGGYGNVLMTQQEPQDVDSLSMSGNSPLNKIVETVKGVGGDIANGDTSFRRTADATQENRSAISEIVETRDENGDLQKVRVITTHLGGDPRVGPKVHDKQYEKFKNWVFDNEKKDQATVLCMDSNGSLEDTTFDFAEKGYITPLVGKTTVPKNESDRGKAIDQCVYKPAGILRLSRIQVLKQYATDHFAILFKRLK